jgi:hypothetical protein
MAYIKYKEITKYFYFYQELDKTSLPKYVLDYIDSDEEILNAFATSRDKGVFTNQKILLFDRKPFSLEKQIHTIPYHSISSISVLFNGSNGAIICYLDSGYPLVLKFREMSPENKSELRQLYSKISKVMRHKKC